MEPIDVIKTAIRGEVGTTRAGIFHNNSGRALLVTIHLNGTGTLALLNKESTTVSDLGVTGTGTAVLWVPDKHRLFANASAKELTFEIQQALIEVERCAPALAPKG